MLCYIVIIIFYPFHSYPLFPHSRSPQGNRLQFRLEPGRPRDVGPRGGTHQQSGKHCPIRSGPEAKAEKDRQTDHSTAKVANFATLSVPPRYQRYHQRHAALLQPASVCDPTGQAPGTLGSGQRWPTIL